MGSHRSPLVSVRGLVWRTCPHPTRAHLSLGSTAPESWRLKGPLQFIALLPGYAFHASLPTGFPLGACVNVHMCKHNFRHYFSAQCWELHLWGSLHGSRGHCSAPGVPGPVSLQTLRWRVSPPALPSSARPNSIRVSSSTLLLPMQNSAAAFSPGPAQALVKTDVMMF